MRIIHSWHRDQDEGLTLHKKKINPNTRASHMPRKSNRKSKRLLSMINSETMTIHWWSIHQSHSQTMTLHKITHTQMTLINYNDTFGSIYMHKLYTHKFLTQTMHGTVIGIHEWKGTVVNHFLYLPTKGRSHWNKIGNYFIYGIWIANKTKKWRNIYGIFVVFYCKNIKNLEFKYLLILLWYIV